MLEQKDKTEKEWREYRNYNANLVFQYKIQIMMARYEIEKHGLQVFRGQEEVIADKGNKVLEIPLDIRQEIYRFMDCYPDYTEEQLAKVLFRESEFFPG